MTPLLFPYTHLTAEMAALAARLLPHLTVYQPVSGRLPDDLQPWISNGFLKISVPVPDDEETVIAAADEYQVWAQQFQHGKNIKTILPGAAPRPPFFDDSSPAQLLAELKGGHTDAGADAPRFFNARLFLCLAQHLDQHREELRRQLNQVDADSNALLEELKPADALEPFSELKPSGASPKDASDFMLSERLNAWTQLFLADRLDEALLLTTSIPIFTDFINSSDRARLLMQFNSGDSSAGDRQASLLAELEKALAQSDRIENQPTNELLEPVVGNADLAIYLIPDRSLRPYLAELAGMSHSDQIHPRAADGGTDHVVIGLLNPGGLE